MEELTGIIRNEDGTFAPGQSAHPEGRPPETSEQKALRKAKKELIAEYVENLAQALPQIEPVLIGKAIAGDIASIKEVHDRVMDKAKQPTEFSGEVALPVRIIEYIKPEKPNE